MARPGARTSRLVGVAAIAVGVGVGMGLAVAVAPVAGAAPAVLPTATSPTATSPAATSPAAASPAAASPVGRSLAARALAAKDRLDRGAAALPATVSSWYVDDATGRLVVGVTGTPSAPLLATLTGSDPAAVAVVGAAPVEALAAADLTGGQAITHSGVRCSLGFAARRADGAVVALTAGHCTRAGGTWAGHNRAAIGPVAATSFPKKDYGAVSLTNTAAWTPRGQVAGGPVVKGSGEAAVGAAVCRSGSTTGYRCGKITAKNVTVNYGNGVTVSGLTKTTACAEHGDSGGSFVTPAGQAQGLTAAGSGTCSKGGVSYFQPLAPVLTALKIKLVTG